MLPTTGAQPTGELREQGAHPSHQLAPPGARLGMGIVAAICAAVMAVIAALVAHHTQPGWLDKAIDDSIRLGPESHSRPLSLIADVGRPITVTVIAVILCAACLLTRRYRGAFLVAVVVPIVGLADSGLKPLIHRTIGGPENLSYPSGHTMGAFCLATMIVLLLTGPLRPPLARRVRVLLATGTLVIACFVSYSLIALRMHYFTDTVGGAALAIAIVLVTALVVDFVADRWAPRRLPSGKKAPQA